MTTNNKNKSTKNPKGNYTEKQQQAIRDSVRAIKDFYGPKVDPQVVNSILANIEIETGFSKLKEGSYSWKNLQENENLVSVRGMLKKWGGSQSDYEKLSHDDKLSVMYWGDTDHSATAGGRGALQLTSAGYGGNDKTDADLRQAAGELEMDINSISGDFYNSTLATLQVYKNRGKDFIDYADSPETLRKSVINPRETLNPKKDSHQKKLDILQRYNDDPFNVEGMTDTSQSIHPDDIKNNPNLSDGAKEELSRANESEGLEPGTVRDLQGGSMLDQYTNGQQLDQNIVNDNTMRRAIAPTSYTGQMDLGAMMQPQRAPGEQPAEDQRENTLGHSGDIGSFASDFNLLDQKFTKGGKVNPKEKKDPTGSDVGTKIMRSGLNLLGVPLNAAQMGAALVNEDSKLGTNDTSRRVNEHLYRSVQNAIKRTGKTKGATEYIDYSPAIDKDLNGLSMPASDMIAGSALSSELQAATTYGRVSYKQNPDTGEIEIYDTYDFSKTPGGSGAYKKLRNAVGEASEGKLDKTPKLVGRFNPNEEPGMMKKLNNVLTDLARPTSMIDMDYGTVKNITNTIGGYADTAMNKAEEIGNDMFKKGKSFINSFEEGGSLNSEQGMNELTEYNEGGSHDQNPNGGVAVGQNQNGGQNLVEQGETRHEDYIFSNQYAMSAEDTERFNLNEKYIGKPFSDVSKEINKLMKDRPYDRLVKKTAKGDLNKLMLAQESVKEEEQMDLMALNQELDIFDQDDE